MALMRPIHQGQAPYGAPVASMAPMAPMGLMMHNLHVSNDTSDVEGSCGSFFLDDSYVNNEPYGDNDS